ncbi:hypothetical protein EDM53_04410, partial [Rickettsiales endosymbiont of Peranema trichophorum]|uniref:hypothetical protein n=1 Tax=Rickettsiales endosymbiont of Peranema trichophorum TaxID=2486577 RepID=UPI0010E8D559
MYWSSQEFKDYGAMVATLSREKPKTLSLDYLSEEYMRHIRTYNSNRGIESLENIGVSIPDGLKHFDKSKKVVDLGEEIKKNRKYSYIDYDYSEIKFGKYVGEVKVDGQSVSIIDQRNIGGCLIRGADVGHLKLGDSVRLVERFDERGCCSIEISGESVALDSSDYETRQANREDGMIEMISRKMCSNERHKVRENLTTEEVYSALYEKLDTFLPEFGFRKSGNHYVSTTGQKIDGSTGKAGKVYVYEDRPWLLMDYTRGKKSIWQYVSETSGGSKREIFEYLASASGLREALYEGKVISRKAVKEREITKSNTKYEASVVDTKKVGDVKAGKGEEPKEERVPQEVWAMIYQYSLNKLGSGNNKVMRYLKEERGYSDEVIKRCGIGYIPNKKGLMAYLKERSVENIELVQKVLGVIGYKHHMVIPLHNKEGGIVGIVGRNIEHSKESEYGKYMFSKGALKGGSMIGIREVEVKEPLV